MSRPGGRGLRCPESGTRYRRRGRGLLRSRAASAVAEREMGIPGPGGGHVPLSASGRKSTWLSGKFLLRECGGGEFPVPRGSRRLSPPGRAPGSGSPEPPVRGRALA